MAVDDHVNWLLEGAKAWNARRKLIDFAPDLSGVNFGDVLGRVETNHQRSFFRLFDLSKSILRNARLSGVDFSGASFVDADLTNAHLSQAKFHRARLDRANLTQVEAAGADFTAARLFGADFTGADLEGARFEGSTLDEASLSKTQHLQIASPPEIIQLEHRLGEAKMMGSEPPREVGIARPKDPQYLVTFATNRALEHDETREFFGGGRAKSLSYGSCKVVIPESHKVGSIGSPFWKRWITRRDDRLKVHELVTLNGELYWRLMAANFADPNESPPTVLIHGYKTGFEEAVLWAAQIGYDLGLERGVSLFSWPSQGKFASYLADEAAVDSSKYLLVEYLLSFMEAAGGRRINILAHSMGCRCLLGALEIIGMKHPERMANLGELIFAAADVDQDSMQNVGAHLIANHGRTTSYVCAGDKALKTSGWLHEYARVGLLPPIFLMDELDTIEVEKTDLLGFGHGYVSGAKDILADMHQLLRGSIHPDNRFSVRAVPHVPGHWKLKE